MKFVISLATVAIADVPEDDTRCPHCWNDWDEAPEPDVDHTVRKTPCVRLFGHDCLVESLMGNKKELLCPCCRQDMVALAARADEADGAAAS